MLRTINREQKRGGSTSFGVTIKERTFAAQNTRYQFNGKEYDSETETSDFGARNLDGDLGVWETVDPQFSRQPGWSTYKAFLDNPIIYQDPDGETEFYFKGKWIGTDGIPNNIIGIAKNNDVKKSILKSTKQGLNFTLEGTVANGTTNNGVFNIHKDVLSAANTTLGQAISNGENKEFWSVLESDNDGGFSTIQSGAGKEGSNQSDGFPTDIQSNVSIHSHPTGARIVKNFMGDKVESKPANIASPEDVSSTFPKFEMNIIVGKQGAAGFNVDQNGKLSIDDNRGSGINIWMSGNTDRFKPSFSISGSDANKMLKGDRGKNGKKFEKKSAARFN